MEDNTKVILITGAAKRIGAAIAIYLHEAGFKLVLHYRHSKKEAEQLCMILNQKRAHSAIALQADLCDTRALPVLVDSAVAAWGRLDALVNNASNFIKTPLGEVTEAVWSKLMDSNLKVPLFLSQLAYPHLAKQGGCIINLTDIHIEKPMRDYAAYCVSKAGLATLTRIMAKEWGPSIRVNAISPGMMAWPEGENTLSEVIMRKIIDEAALKRIGDPQDIAKAVLFFIRDADYITGQILAVDGGRLL